MDPRDRFVVFLIAAIIAAIYFEDLPTKVRDSIVQAVKQEARMVKVKNDK